MTSESDREEAGKAYRAYLAYGLTCLGGGIVTAVLGALVDRAFLIFTVGFAIGAAIFLPVTLAMKRIWGM